MNKFLSFFVLISSSLILFASISIFLAYQTSSLKINSNKGSLETKITYKDKSGNLKYAKGSCNLDSDCVPAGCSSQICSNDLNLITTCEMRSDFPDKKVYACGCIEGACAWYKK